MRGLVNKQDALPHNPWRNGTIYLLPHDTFEQQPLRPGRGLLAEIAQWASLVPVEPIAKLSITPEDFPLLSEIRGHNLDVLRARMERNPDGFPWLDDEEGDAIASQKS